MENAYNAQTGVSLIKLKQNLLRVKTGAANIVMLQICYAAWPPASHQTPDLV